MVDNEQPITGRTEQQQSSGTGTGTMVTDRIMHKVEKALEFRK